MIAGACVTLAAQGKGNLPPWAGGVILGGVLAGIVLLIVLSVHFEKKRRAAIKAALGAAGFVGEGKVEELRTPPAEALGPIERLATRAEKTTWGVEGEAEGVAMVLLEHQYSTGSGKSRTTHNHSVASMAVPAGWPRLDVYAEHLFHKIGEMFGSHDFRVEDEAFNKRWRVTGESEDFAVLFLTPEVQAMLMGWDRSTFIAVKGGRLCVYRSGHLNAEGWTAMVGRAAALRKLLPAELDAWRGGAG